MGIAFATRNEHKSLRAMLGFVFFLALTGAFGISGTIMFGGAA